MKTRQSLVVLWASTTTLTGVLAVGQLLTGVPAAHAAAGDNGTLKVQALDAAGLPIDSPGDNDPKVCSFRLEAAGFDVTQTQVAYYFVAGPKFDGDHLIPGTLAITDGAGHTDPLTLPDGQYKPQLGADDLNGADNFKVFKVDCAGTPDPSPSPTESASPEPTETASPEPTETASPEPTESASPEPTESASPEPTESASPEPTESASPEPTESASPEPEPTETGDFTGGGGGVTTDVPGAVVPGTAGSGTITTPVTAPTVTGGGGLPFTGDSTATLLAWAVSALLSGAALLGLGRKSTR